MAAPTPSDIARAYAPMYVFLILYRAWLAYHVPQKRAYGTLQWAEDTMRLIA